MTKDKFLNQLNSLLKNIPKDEREDILQDYVEHFTFGLAEGKTEDEISAALGSPTQIAKELLANYHLEKVTTSVTAGNIFRAVWAVFGLSFFNLVIVLGPAIAFTSLIISGWVMGIALTVTPLLVIVDAVVHPGAFLLYHLFFSMILCGIGYFIMLAMYYITKWATNGFVRYLKFNASLVKGGLTNDK
ncbi:DUF1700 domain-containing protein [Caldibacillus lycopersici]|uniref:DUF1700 domain-containing protein n=1 Tax=Perspicuibacillus lycopersici TaxID=1325689 RepID=A0AAE3ITQ4_9BACI|nr:DUF1700 domain-containing protein [Perspicuibacillus lycopersici]MCU9613428.1 DUF1700 domain-containing protein [Perspicuibacillus lycopersici]